MIERIDERVIDFLKHASIPLARFSFFIIFFWFGILKLFSTSPANPLVNQLLEQTLPFVSFDQFIIFLGLYEMTIGLIFLLPRCERVAIALLLPHMFTTTLPLVLLPSVTWGGFFVPTLDGQYIIKNIVIIALAISLGAHVVPLKSHKKHNESHFEK